LHGTLPLITTRADLCEQEGSGGVAEQGQSCPGGQSQGLACMGHSL
jgi:hypothetical protein